MDKEGICRDQRLTSRQPFDIPKFNTTLFDCTSPLANDVDESLSTTKHNEHKVVYTMKHPCQILVHQHVSCPIHHWKCWTVFQCHVNHPLSAILIIYNQSPFMVFTASTTLITNTLLKENFDLVDLYENLAVAGL